MTVSEGKKLNKMIIGNTKIKLALDGGMDVGFKWDSSQYEKLKNAINDLVNDGAIKEEEVYITNFHIENKENVEKKL